MKYQYTCKTTAADLWQLSMYYTYGSLVGVCNLIFTFAMFALGVSRWQDAPPLYRCLIVAGCLLFTVIQPSLIYLKAKKQAAAITQVTQVGFDDSGMHVDFNGKRSSLRWNKIKKVSKKPTMIVVFSDTTHGFIFTNRVLGAEKAEFYEYLVSKVGGNDE